MVFFGPKIFQHGHARGYVTPKSLEPRSCPNERMEAVKAAALAISAETFRRGAGEDGRFPHVAHGEHNEMWGGLGFEIHQL